VPGLVGLSSTNAGTANEAIQTATNQVPYAVTPGSWSILVVNAETNDVNYCFKITEYYATNIVPLTLQVGLAQSSAAGQTTYYVVNVDTNYCGLSFRAGVATNLLIAATFGRLPNAGDTYMTTPPGIGPIAPPYPHGNWFVTVVNTNLTPQNFTVIAFTNSCGPPFAPTILVDFASQMTNGFLLRWLAPTNEQYQVQHTASLNPVINWQTFPGVVTSTNGLFEYLDSDATNNAQRFYQLLRVP
jgi:hypothetical protein